ncbi:MAG: ASCH domain-containing protein [Ignavibacteria bacterium]
MSNRLVKNSNTSVEELWKRHIKQYPEHVNSKYKHYYFCDNEKCANELAELVKNEIKKATASLLFWYDKGEEVMPEVSDINIITDWSGMAQCIIRTVKVTILSFKEVTAEMAYKEGEGDRSLEYWKNAHVNFFIRDLKNENLKFTEDLKIVFEEFEMIYK